ncbi:ADP-ribosylation factor-like protein 15 isoform X3 [Anolis carolinensis]|uniref:ADP-ribosylation factor-like protein 15 isoform X3 n=1 Tax=Anolis carolinensis TaxID=28377 RepID=UPI002F2B859A
MGEWIEGRQRFDCFPDETVEKRSLTSEDCYIATRKLQKTKMSECIQLSFAVCRIGIYTCFRALCCKGPPPPRPEYDLVCIGLTGSGKTSLLSQLCSENRENIVSTTGFSIKAVPFQNAILNVKELGGADNIRKYWSRYYQGSQGVIFVLDSASSEDDLEIARNELHSALQHPQLCTLPFLILANHQDKPAARSVQETEQLIAQKQWNGKLIQTQEDEEFLVGDK